MVPIGKVQLPSRLKPKVILVSGRQNHRFLWAPSDQSGTLISKGTRPGCGVRVVRSEKAPVSASVGGNVGVCSGGVSGIRRVVLGSRSPNGPSFARSGS